MSHGQGIDGSSVDWLLIAKHIEAAKNTVIREHTSALIKFDGERTNGRIYTVIVFGAGSDDHIFQAETSGLEGAVTNAFPVDSDVETSQTVGLADLLRKWDKWARSGLILLLQIFVKDDSVVHMACIREGRGDVVDIRVQAPSVFIAISESVRQYEQVRS
ncbi:hypothetical protein [Luteibacter sp. UNC138MFCol5.1]|uniref:hypothetical protein n=1 Tax=Luteibacter sp. UNC138MFCol5.1 TaxID=1502774 RepID=UPI000B7D40B9|nr:hypothetical protein [Luteibacter sp. UNC138MFCol5.1]